ncbi:6-bladed beta-propeller [Bacteroides sp. 519]|uniref:6-bladed beta-propeller n=1 Tax=Bacteroides sp. 519 TaxID=2302937 RepID=UPI0013D7770D|nr:6-bladed beta-propeller [Bacteroides sp. 519]NDV57146.1 6-bladed beta-propeller [Bacteroides sp. 519]
MKYRILFFLILITLFISCDSNKLDSILSVSISNLPIDFLNISEVTNEIIPIELELTDESIIGEWQQGYRIIISKKHIVFFDNNNNTPKILLFTEDGRFVRVIGKKGQGPGEYTSIGDIAVDEMKNLIYIICPTKILTFSFDGELIAEHLSSLKLYEEANFMNGELQLLVSSIHQEREREYVRRVNLFTANENIITIDSMSIFEESLKQKVIVTPTVRDYLTFSDGKKYLYYPIELGRLDIPNFCDTLFEIKNQQLIPSVKIIFDGKYMRPTSVFKTSRFVFVIGHRIDYRECSFCYDADTERTYNLTDGFMDDIHTNTKVRIRPNPLNSNLFYYLFNNIGGDGEELNPTLFIGKFKL